MLASIGKLCSVLTGHEGQVISRIQILVFFTPAEKLMIWK
jgi:hypothetical protein